MSFMQTPIYYFNQSNAHNGYIAGRDDGITTIESKPVSRKVYLLDSVTLKWLKTCVTLENGHYMFMGLDPSKSYIVMARDYHHDFEPVCYDNVIPETDLTLVEQKELWLSWR
ncbi:MAG: hypothetical protein CSA10_00710 [Cardiobacteriales bacterium]|nr:MAG: hypothetical protein CSA10_00710 [Cardiobacteriales bacterium]